MWLSDAYDHGKLTQPIRPVRGFKTLKTAYATIKGFEVMRALPKGQVLAFNITIDIGGEARIVERAFWFGAFALAEAVQFVKAHFTIRAARRAHLTDTVFALLGRQNEAEPLAAQRDVLSQAEIFSGKQLKTRVHVYLAHVSLLQQSSTGKPSS